MASREEYDRKLSVIRAVHNPFRFGNVKRRLGDFIDNFSSRLLLFWSRLLKREWKDEWEDIKQEVGGMSLFRIRSGIYLLFKRFSLLPRWGDRIMLFGELIWDNKYTILLTATTTALLSSYLQHHYMNSADLLELF